MQMQEERLQLMFLKGSLSRIENDGFNPEDPGIKDVVENLQEIRNTTHVDDDVEEDNEIHLFVKK